MRFFQKARKLATLLAVAAILIGLPSFFYLRTSAATGPTTYAVKYLPDKGEWRYQSKTSTFNENAPHRELYYLSREMQDGDQVAVYNDSESAPPKLELGFKRLGNLTVTATKSFTIIYAGDIENCYLLGGAFCSINAKVANAYLYDTVLGNFNRDVTNLFVYSENSPTATVGCGGTVERLNVISRTTGKIFYSLYDFQADSLSLTNGVLKTDKSKYAVTPKTPARILTAENFDYVRYANDYPDVMNAFGLNADLLYMHYTTAGILDGRTAYPTRPDSSSFDHVRYANDYPDLTAVFGYDAQLLYNHYITKGIAEGRGNYLAVTIYDYFDHVRYANDHPDLKAAFSYNAQALYDHYIKRGITENRGYYISTRISR